MEDATSESTPKDVEQIYVHLEHRETKFTQIKPFLSLDNLNYLYNMECEISNYKVRIC